MYNVYAVSVLLYGCETQVLLQSDEWRLAASTLPASNGILGIHYMTSL